MNADSQENKESVDGQGQAGAEKRETFGLCLSHRAAFAGVKHDKCPMCRLLEDSANATTPTPSEQPACSDEKVIMSIIKRSRAKSDPNIRFWAKVNKSSRDGCWIWGGTVLPNGYGNFRWNGKSVGAHRACLMLLGAEIPKGMYVMHSCDNPLCVRPEHLSIGTAKDNLWDSISKKRHRLSFLADNKCARGHEFTPENTATKIRNGKTERQCLVCREIRWRKQIR